MPATVSAKSPEPGQLVLQLSLGYMASSALRVVTQLEIPDLLADGPKSVAALARNAQANEDALYRVLRALASVGVFEETEPRVFALTPAAETLRRGTPDSLRDMVLWIADPIHYRCFPEMLHAVKTGEPVIEKVTGSACFAYFEKDKVTGEVFNAAMTGFSAMMIPAVLEAYDFSPLNGGKLVDVAGGHGHVLTEILKKYPKINGMLFDLAHVAEGAKEPIRSAGLEGRCGVASGDFFVSVPPGNAYIMKHIIHDWDDERALKILRSIHAAAIGKAKVILLESVLEPGNEPHLAKWIDIEMLMLPGGRERTEEEFAKLCEKAGFCLTRVVRTKSPVCVIEAEKVS